MKQISCQELGGPDDCNAMLAGVTASELIGNGWEHIKEAHPELANDIEHNPPEVNEKWQAEFRAKFDSLSDVESHDLELI